MGNKDVLVEAHSNFNGIIESLNSTYVEAQLLMATIREIKEGPKARDEEINSAHMAPVSVEELYTMHITNTLAEIKEMIKIVNEDIRRIFL